MLRKLHIRRAHWSACCFFLLTAFSSEASNPSPENCQLSLQLIPTMVSCNGAGDGKITLVIFDENDPPLIDQIEWSTGAMDQEQLSGLAPGIYSVTVTNTTECTATASIEITEPTGLGSIVLDVQDVLCAGEENGEVVLTAFGGTPPYTYHTPEGDFTINGGEQLLLTGVAPGNYSISLEDLNGCTINSAYTVEEPLPLEMASFESIGVECPDDTTGFATLVPSGGVEPYTYQWSNGANGPTVENLGSGPHLIQVFDANGCLLEWDFEIEILDVELPQIQAQPITLFLDQNGEAVLQAEMLDAGSTDNCGITSLEVDQSMFNCDEVGLQPVTLMAMDSQGNMSTTSVSISIQDTIQPTLELPNDTILYDCSGYFEYEVFALDNCQVNQPSLVVGLPSGSNFPIGTTEVIWEVTDIPGGNKATRSFTVTVANTLTAAIDAAVPSCAEANGGMASVIAQGGTPPYNYLWDDTNAQTSDTAFALPGGLYTVWITDSTGCTTQAEVAIEELPLPVVTSFNIINENFNNQMGGIQINPSGEEPLTFQWYQNGVPFSTEEDLSGIAGGFYFVEITDANGCVGTSQTYEVRNITSTREVSIADQIQILPNPVLGKTLIVRLPVAMMTAPGLQVRVFDNTGQTIPIQWMAGAEQLQVLLPDLTAGMYWLRLETAGVFASRGFLWVE